ncbi:Uncharacterised protein [Mycobacteroides abscessus subsp. abscessus]|nr:Uncharacterised protein [Mycobacteroides abscessus subsp. abscessus]
MQCRDERPGDAEDAVTRCGAEDFVCRQRCGCVEHAVDVGQVVGSGQRRDLVLVDDAHRVGAETRREGSTDVAPDHDPALSRGVGR